MPSSHNFFQMDLTNRSIWISVENEDGVPALQRLGSAIAHLGLIRSCQDALAALTKAMLCPRVKTILEKPQLT